MKRALVFSGGGSRGAYEIGAWQALEDLGIRFQAFYGTSIGAMNAALAAQGDVEKARQLWENIEVSQIVAVGEGQEFSINRMIANKREVIPFLLDNAKYLGADISPLEDLVAANVDEGRVRASGVTLGVMTARLPQMQPVPKRLSGMEEGTLHDWVIASASCFPVFPLKAIGQDRYVDGGLFDNLPVGMALADGADEVVAVDLHPRPTHPEYLSMPFFRSIQPLHSLGGFLDFDRRLLRRSLLLGYHDAMKAYGALDGIRYTFRKQGGLRQLDEARRFVLRVAAFDEAVAARLPFRATRASDAPLGMALTRETPGRALSWREAYLRGLELCAQAMAFREDAIYDEEDLTRRITAFAGAGDPVEIMDERGLTAAAAAGSRSLIGWLYRGLKSLGDYPSGLLGALAEHPAEAAAALYLHTAAAGAQTAIATPERE